MGENVSQMKKKPIRITADFLMTTLKGKTAWNNAFKVLKGYVGMPRLR